MDFASQNNAYGDLMEEILRQQLTPDDILDRITMHGPENKGVRIYQQKVIQNRPVKFPKYIFIFTLYKIESY